MYPSGRFLPVLAAAILVFPPLAGAGSHGGGAKVFERVCAACHQANGQGVGNVFPPLRDSDYLRADLDRAISSVINGLSGPIVVNGVEYNTAMPPMAYLSDEEVASVLTFVLEEWNGGAASRSSRSRRCVPGTSPDTRWGARSNMPTRAPRAPSRPTRPAT